MTPSRTSPPSTRRRFIAQLGALTASLRVGRGASAEPSALAAAFDPVMEGFLRDRGFPGGALAVARGGKVVYAQGYGLADIEAKEAARPDSLFRIASLAKPITALAVLKLAESGGLRLETPFVDILGSDPRFPARDRWPEGWDRITIRQLLQHTGGWDRDASFDPMFRTRAIMTALNLNAVPGTWDVIRYMSGHPLDHPPGERYAYSNFGYCLLGRVIERAGGVDYQTHVQRRLLEPLGIRTMRLGATLPNQRVPGEVRYYMPRNQTARCVFPGVTLSVPWPYGGFLLEIMDAHGGWIASAPDLARLSAALQLGNAGRILKSDSLQQIVEPPPAPVSRKDGELEATFYGLGWMVRPVPSGTGHNAWHNGSLPGTSTLWVRRADGVDFVALFNQRSDEGREKDGEIDPRLNRAVQSVPHWLGK